MGKVGGWGCGLWVGGCGLWLVAVGWVMVGDAWVEFWLVVNWLVGSGLVMLGLWLVGEEWLVIPETVGILPRIESFVGILCSFTTKKQIANKNGWL